MVDKMYMLSYSKGLRSVKAIKEKCEIRKLLICLTDTSPAYTKFSRAGTSSSKKVVFNWGNVYVPTPHTLGTYVYNNINKSIYINKRKFFETYFNNREVSAWLPRHFTNEIDAVNFIEDRNDNTGIPVLVERTVLTGHSGEGIRLIRGREDMIRSSLLWVEYKKKSEEYRVHFFKKPNGVVELFIQKKLLKRGVNRPQGQPESVFKVRNLDNGWVYSHNHVAPSSVHHAAEALLFESALDYGAIDIIYSRRNDCAWILEVNTAPGAVESTAQWYADMFTFCYNYVISGNIIVPVTRSSQIVVYPIIQQSVPLEGGF